MTTHQYATAPGHTATYIGGGFTRAAPSWGLLQHSLGHALPPSPARPTASCGRRRRRPAAAAPPPLWPSSHPTRERPAVGDDRRVGRPPAAGHGPTAAAAAAAVANRLPYGNRCRIKPGYCRKKAVTAGAVCLQKSDARQRCFWAPSSTECRGNGTKTQVHTRQYRHCGCWSSNVHLKWYFLIREPVHLHANAAASHARCPTSHCLRRMPPPSCRPQETASPDNAPTPPTHPKWLAFRSPPTPPPSPIALLRTSCSTGSVCSTASSLLQPHLRAAHPPFHMTLLADAFAH